MAFVGVHSWSQLKNERVYAYMSAVEASIIFVITLANGTGMLIDYVVLLVSAYYGFYLTIRYEAAKIVLHQLGIE